MRTYCLFVAAIFCLQFQVCQADIVVPSDSFGGFFRVLSGDANLATSAQSGSAGFAQPNQLLTFGGFPDIEVVSSHIQFPDSSWQIVLEYSTSNSDSFIPQGLLINAEEINSWSFHIGDTSPSTDALGLLGDVTFNSVTGDWLADGSTIASFDYLNDFNGNLDSISGIANYSIAAGGDIGNFNAGSDLGALGIDQFRLTINVTAIPEPVVGTVVLFAAALLGLRRRR